ncbi:glycoside hydrolase family 9 protein [Pseudoalteromonas sp. NBT06-2]|uniref:glycoside hydrolase family 9 protein n=1 Tax=Pseudoalteromonas sp. NBT06-2 TaxID=2025950 RepID=UPI001482950D|nr:glycoside hydrolase family 9 protein [Pseudoalteromonas sp. NBT06-2]
MIAKLLTSLFILIGAYGVFFLNKLPVLQDLDITKEETYFSVNQVGYFIFGPKIAYITHFKFNKTIKLVNLDTQKVTQLKIKPLHFNNSELSATAKIDFSQIQEPGEYILLINNIRSPKFKINQVIYSETITQLLRSFYYQRCGQSINDELFKINHKACHLKDAVLSRALYGVDIKNYSSFSAVGGWHDAGDFGKYVATTTVSLGRVLSSYQDHPDILQKIDLSLNKPEGILPDVLVEMQYGLDWLLTMQYVNGSVFRKVAGKNWPSLMSPVEDVQTRYVYGISTEDTAKFAATMALAARIWIKFDRVKAETYFNAAQKAWQYLEQEQSYYIDWNKSDDSGSGPYKSNNVDTEASLLHDNDDRFWAAAELYITTKNKIYLQYINKNIELPVNIFEWKDPSLLGKWNLITQLCQAQSLQYCTIFKHQILTRAAIALSRYDKSDYALANQKFIWGSNKIAAEEGILLLMAYQLNGEKKYFDAAVAQADYLLGSNPFSLSFVTGIGERAVKHINHIWARAENIEIPGLLVGGPNSLAQAKIAPKNKGILSYVDNEKSYAVNEYAIDYNASLITLLIQLSVFSIEE